LEKAISSIVDLQYNQKLAISVCSNIEALPSIDNWDDVLRELNWMTNYKSDYSVGVLTANIYNKFYKDIPSSCELTKYNLCNTIKSELSSDDTFYGRFYRQLRLDQKNKNKNKDYIIE
jgi:hypothetical protein